MRGSSSKLLLLLPMYVPLIFVCFFFFFFTTQSTAKTFNCSVVGATCRALIDYVPSNETTSLSHVQALFGVKNLRSLLGANNLPLSTSLNFTLPANLTFRIPFHCKCSNGTGKSNGGPFYTIQKDDGLDHIATDIFDRLVTFQEIADANGIPNPNLIATGKRLKIPIPCNCDTVGGSDVVHYGHLVAAGSSVEIIAETYGVDQATLLTINGIADPRSLQAGDVLDVPLKACASMVGRGSLDYPLLVSNGTYLFTAQNCVMCKCDAANNWTLHCEPSRLVTASNSTWQACPAMRCEGSANLLLGDTTSSACSPSCAYAGYTNQTILTSLTNVSTCPAPTPSVNFAATIFLHGSSWNLIFICNHLLLLYFIVQ